MRPLRAVALSTVISASMAAAVLTSAGVSGGTCTTLSDVGADAQCTSSLLRLDGKSSVSAQGVIDGNVGFSNKNNAAAGASPSPGSGSSAASGPLAVAQSMLGTDTFGPYGCEDFVDAAYGRTTANGIGHDQAANFYYALADQGLGHHDMPIPRGALVFTSGPDGDHVDISRGDGTYISGGVQGLSPGYGDGHNVQVLPSPNLGSWTLYGWVNPPW